MRMAVIFAIFSLVGVGCSVPESAIVGTWVANPSRVDRSTANVLSKVLAERITFRSDKTYQYSWAFGPSTHAESGKWRIAGNKVYIQQSELDSETSFELDGNDLVGRFGDLPLPYERKPQVEETPAKQK